MGAFVLISGENNSGKSRFAEELIAGTAGKRYYIATMKPCTAENERRIKKHRIQRQGLGFETIEASYGVGELPVFGGAVLLEDVSNLLANVMFERGGTVDRVFDEIKKLAEKSGLLVAVTIAGLSPEGYDEETASYIDGLNQLNRRLFSLASAAVRLEEGKPVYEKGDPYGLF